MPAINWILFIICASLFFPVLFQPLDSNYALSTDTFENDTSTQYCPDGCICVPSTVGTSIITCSCKHEFIGLRLSTPAPLVTIPLGGDYSDDDNDFKSVATEYHAGGLSTRSQLYLPADVFAAFGRRIGRIVIHGCESVTVAGWAFRSVEVVEQLKFTDIAHLTFEPHALSALQKAPKQIVIQDSYVDLVASHAFSGLFDVEHIWWRNSTIERIAKLAFFKLTNVGYFYFRDVIVDEIENGAFAHLRQIQHLFFRRNILLRHVGEFVLLNAKVDEIVIEDARLNTTAYSFLGLRSRHVTLRNCVWLVSSQKNTANEAVRHRIPHQSIIELNVQNTTIDSIFLAHFYNITSVSITNSQIDDLQSLQPEHPFGSSIAFSIGSITFRFCRISRWLSHALRDARKIGELSFINTHIFFIARSAVHNSQVDTLRFVQTRLNTISANAFSQNRIRRADIDAIEMVNVGDALFYHTQFEEFSLRNSRIRAENANMFAEILHCKMCEISACSFTGFPEKMFDNATVTSIAIRDSEFENAFQASALLNLHADELLITRSVFACNPTFCEDNALLLHKTIHDNVAWMFTNNKCVPQRRPSIPITSTPSEDIGNEHTAINDIEYALLTSSEIVNDEGRYDDYRPSENICVDEFETIDESGIICRRRALIEECVCLQSSDNGESHRSLVNAVLPDTTAKILLVGDCPRLSFKSERKEADLHYSQRPQWTDDNLMKPKRPNLEFLYLYRINALELDADFDATLRRINILYANVNITTHRATQDHNKKKAHIHNLMISGSIVETIDEYAFSSIDAIDSIVFNRTIVRYIRPNAFSRSQVKRIELWHSDLLTSGNMLEHVDELRIEQSRIARPAKIAQTSADNFSFTSLTPYELCMLRAADRSDCQKCLHEDGCADFAANAATPSAIIKRCARAEDCDDDPDISRNILDFYVSDVSSADAPAKYMTLFYVTGFLIFKYYLIYHDL